MVIYIKKPNIKFRVSWFKRYSRKKWTDTTDRVTFAETWSVEIYLRFSEAETNRSENRRIDEG